MLKNDYLLAKIGVDTAENEPRREGPQVDLRPPRADREPGRETPAPSAARVTLLSPGRWHATESQPGTHRVMSARVTSLFLRLVLGCIDADFGHQIVILQH